MIAKPGEAIFGNIEAHMMSIDQKKKKKKGET
jgi:hypothetical protein